jgi:hypothetical protein
MPLKTEIIGFFFFAKFLSYERYNAPVSTVFVFYVKAICKTVLSSGTNFSTDCVVFALIVHLGFPFEWSVFRPLLLSHTSLDEITII